MNWTDISPTHTECSESITLGDFNMEFELRQLDHKGIPIWFARMWINEQPYIEVNRQLGNLSLEDAKKHASGWVFSMMLTQLMYELRNWSA